MEIKLLDKEINSNYAMQHIMDFLRLNGFEDNNICIFNRKDCPNLYIHLYSGRPIVKWRWSDNETTIIFSCEYHQFDKFLIFLQNFDYDKQVEMTKLGGRNEA